MTPRRPFAAAHPFATAAMPRPVLKVMIASPSGRAAQAPALALIRKGRARRVREVGDAVSGRRSRGPSRLPVGSHQHRLRTRWASAAQRHASKGEESWRERPRLMVRAVAPEPVRGRSRHDSRCLRSASLCSEGGAFDRSKRRVDRSARSPARALAECRTSRRVQR